MAMCSLAVAWGNVADWASVVVAAGALAMAAVSALIALAGAIAVAYLGLQANRQVVRMDENDSQIRSREADLLMIMLEAEIAMFGVSLRLLVDFLKAGGQKYETDINIREATADRVSALLIPETDANFHRLHVLPDEVGYSLARVKGILSVMRTTVDLGRRATDSQAQGVLSSIQRTSKNLLSEIAKLESATTRRRKELGLGVT